MSDSYILACMDELGRVVIPIQMRKMLGMKPRNNVRLCFNGESIKLTAIDESETSKLVNEVKQLAEGNKNIKEGEYNNLCEILDKLGGK